MENLPAITSYMTGLSNTQSRTRTTSGHMPKHLTPDQAVKLYGSKLSPYEDQEIAKYNCIYFVGQNAKKYRAVPGGAGYDGESGSYQVVAHDHVAYRYEILKAFDHKTQQQHVRSHED